MNIDYFVDGIRSLFIAGSDPHSAMPMQDPFGQTTPLPFDILRKIFVMLKADLPTIALVSKNWKVISDDDELREMIRPAEAFGIREWQEYIGVDAGKEPVLPRRVYGDLEKWRCCLTFIPEKVKKIQENGQIQEIVLNQLKTVDALVANSIKGNKMGFYQELPIPTDHVNVLNKIRKCEKSHWVLLGKDLQGVSKCLGGQQVMASNYRKSLSGTEISGLMDTVISIFMHFVRYGECDFLDAFKNQEAESEDKKSKTYIRLTETLDHYQNRYATWKAISQINLRFSLQGLGITHGLPYGAGNVFVLFASKFFDPDPKTSE